MPSKHVVMSLNNEFTTDYRVYREATALVQAGHDVTLFCVYRKGLKGAEEVDGIHVRRIFDNFIRLPVSREAKSVRAIWRRALLEARADLYHAHDRDTLDETVRAAEKLGVKCIYDSHEYWPDKNRYENNTGSLRDRASEAWWNLKERRNAQRVDALIVTSPGHGDALVERYGLARRFGTPGYTLVRNIPLYQRGTDKQLLQRKFNLPANSRIVVYIGNVQRNRGLEEVIASLALLPSHVHFVIVGYGAYAAELKRKLPAAVAERVHFYGTIPFKEIVPTIYSADVGVAPFQANCYSHYHVLPNKPFDYMMAELPVAASDFPDLRAMLDAAGAGVYFDPASPKDIARALRSVLDDPDKQALLKANARQATETRLRWDKEQASLLALYRRLLG